MKFSIIITAYNTENYIEKCLLSVFNQSYQNYEIIFVNDGSTDKTLQIAKKFKNDKMLIVNQTNKGVSYSRNIAVKKAKGDYILFLDSDDYYELKLLEKLNNFIKNEDVIKFNYKSICKDKIVIPKNINFKNLDGKAAITQLINSKIIFDMNCIYAFKLNYFKKFKYEIGRYHEDLGLIPIVIYKANNVASINYIGYNYNRINETSITSFVSNEKEFKKAMDVLYYFKNVKKNIDNDMLVSYYANAVINKVKLLNQSYKKEYIKFIKEEQVIDCLLDNNLKRKIKKILLKISFFVKWEE